MHATSIHIYILKNRHTYINSCDNIHKENMFKSNKIKVYNTVLVTETSRSVITGNILS